SREAVREAIAECGRVGQETFLKKYGVQQARSYFLAADGGRCGAKAVGGVAHGYQFPGEGPLHASEFSGGEATVKAKLEALGFVIAGPKNPSRPLPPLTVDQRYTWDDLGRLLDFQPSYLGAVGGMVPRLEFNALLL